MAYGRPAVALAVAVAALLAAGTAGAVDFSVSNTAAATPGGARFDKEIGAAYAKKVLADATNFIWRAFRETTPADRKPVNSVSLVVEDIDGVAFTAGNGIHLSARYVGGYGGNVKTEITGVLYHEMTHVWQWDGKGKAPGGLIEGMADFVRLRAGFAPSHWVKPGGGDRWDQGYDVTARFLDYLEGLSSGFVAKLNRLMRNGYSDDFFKQLLGKPVDQLWKDYKAKFGKETVAAM